MDDTTGPLTCPLPFGPFGRVEGEPSSGFGVVRAEDFSVNPVFVLPRPFNCSTLVYWRSFAVSLMA